MKISTVVLALAFASATGGMAMSSALGQADDLNARKAQDRDQDDRIETYNRGREQPQDQQATPQIRQAPYRRTQPGYEDSERYAQPAYAPPPAYYYPTAVAGLSLQSPRIGLYVRVAGR